MDSVWPLTLDQDLIDTLKVSFPNWFSSSTTAITEGGKSGLNAATDKNSTLNLKTTLDGMEEGNKKKNSLFFILKKLLVKKKIMFRRNSIFRY